MRRRAVCLTLLFLLLGFCLHGEAEGPTIACVIPSYPDIVFWADIESNMQKKARELGAEPLILYTRHSEASLALGLNNALSIAVYAGADAIIASYTLADAQTDGILALAKSKGIPVVMIDCDCPESLRDAYIGIDNLSAGRQMGEIALEGMRPGEKCLLVYSANSPARVNLLERIQGARQAFEEQEKELKEQVLTSLDIQTVFSLRQVLADDPAIRALIAINENTTLLCAQALAAQPSRSILLYGFDESADTLALLQSGAIEALACQTHGEMGNRSVETAVALLNGDADAVGIHLIDFEIARRQP